MDTRRFGKKSPQKPPQKLRSHVPPEPPRTSVRQSAQDVTSIPLLKQLKLRPEHLSDDLVRACSLLGVTVSDVVEYANAAPNGIDFLCAIFDEARFQAVLDVAYRKKMRITSQQCLALVPLDPSCPKHISGRHAVRGSGENATVVKRVNPVRRIDFSSTIVGRHPLTRMVMRRLTKAEKATRAKMLRRSGTRPGRPSSGLARVVAFFLVEADPRSRRKRPTIDPDDIYKDVSKLMNQYPLPGENRSNRPDLFHAGNFVPQPRFAYKTVRRLYREARSSLNRLNNIARPPSETEDRSSRVRETVDSARERAEFLSRLQRFLEPERNRVLKHYRIETSPPHGRQTS